MLTHAPMRNRIANMNYLETLEPSKTTTQFVRVAPTASKWFMHPDSLSFQSNQHSVTKTTTRTQVFRTYRKCKDGQNTGPMGATKRPMGPFFCSTGGGTFVSGRDPHAGQNYDPSALQAGESFRSQCRAHPQCSFASSFECPPSTCPASLKRTQPDTRHMGRPFQAHARQTSLRSVAAVRMSEPVVLAQASSRLSLIPFIGCLA